MSIQHARQRAEKLVEHVIAPPIDVAAIANTLGVPVFVLQLEPDISGMLISRGGSSHIVVRKEDHEHRQRFSVAHELGHFCLAHQSRQGDHVHVDRGNFISHRGPRAAAGIDPMEIEANQFAACLLMPERLLTEFATKQGAPDLKDQHVSDLARAFRVSDQAMTIRLTSLGLL